MTVRKLLQFNITCVIFGVWIAASVHNSKAAPLSNNARDYYLAAERAVDDSVIGFYPKINTDFAPGSAALSPAELKHASQILRANKKAIDLVRQGMLFPYRTPPDLVGGRNGHDFSSMRGFSYLLMLEAHADAASGNWAGCANCGIEVIRLGFDFHRTGDPLALVVGAAMEETGREAIYAGLPHLGADAAHIARNLDHAESFRGSSADVLQAEEDALLRQFDGLQMEATKHPGSAPTKAQMKPMLDYERQYKNFMDAMIANERMPYAEQKSPVAEPTNPQVHQIYAAYKTTWLTRGNTLSGFWYAKSRAVDHLLITQLALRAFHATTGHYPDTLAQLVPAQLTAIPADSFALAAPLQYKKQGDTYLLYSVGPDGIDDGGQPIDYKSAKTEREWFQVGVLSKGDIVAGINTK